MALARWSLDRLVAWIGAGALLVLFVPTGIYFSRSVSMSAEECLSERGHSLASALAAQILEPMLLADRLRLDDAVHKVASIESEVRYLSVEDRTGRIVAHTFAGNPPLALAEMWKQNGSGVMRFRTGSERLMDVAAPILGGQLGTVHLGISRARARAAADVVTWQMGGALAAAIGVILIGSRMVAAGVSRPLRRLEAEVARFPREPGAGHGLPLSGTREVASLAGSFEAMAQRFRALERDRAATQRKMVQAERLAAFGEVAACLAHEIHNPLDGMLECLRYLEADPNRSDRADKYYPMLKDGLGRIARVMRQVLAFVRSGQHVSVEACAVSTILEELEMLVSPQVEGRGVRLTWQKAETCACRCDRPGLAQAGLNLILNAVDAAEDSADPHVRIQVTCDSDWVRLVVDDTGGGVPQHLRERIFTLFCTTKPIGKGTGLGLPVSRQLVQAAGGELELAREPGPLGGARFVIRLPRLHASEGCDG